MKSIDLRALPHIEFGYAWIEDISFLDIDVVMVTTGSAEIFFVFVQSGQCFSRFQLENSTWLLETTVLSDGRICVAGREGYCVIVQPLQDSEDCINYHVERMFSRPTLARIPFFTPPVKATFEGIQNKSLSIANAFELAIDSKFDARSIREWGYTHLIVMTAVKSGDIPPSRSFKGDVIYWWNHLYKIASSIEMGEHDWNVVLKFIVAAEEAGILGGGCAECLRR